MAESRDEPRAGALSALLRAVARAPPVSAAPPPVPGSRLGRYEILREIGRGGFGVVFEALDPDLDRKVALKVLRSHRGREMSDAWLRSEAEAAARLDHPGIVTLLEAGVSEFGPWLALELLRGETLEKRLSRGPVGPREALAIALAIARALGHAHARGVLHRDLKPGNVFLTDEGRVKLLDFGLAHLLGTRGDAPGGTPAYMAPEQARGYEVDARADVFALGAVLHALLSGSAPFEVRDGRSAVLDSTPARPLPEGTPAPLARAVQRLLASDPALRPASGDAAAEMLLDAERALARPRARRRTLALVVAGALAGGVIAAAAIHWRAPAASPVGAPVTLAVLPLVNLSGDAGQEYFSDGMTEEITGKLSRLRGLAVTARTSVMRYKGSARGAREIGAELGVAYLVEGSVRRAGDRIRVTATLVKTTDAFQLWSEEFDARLDDVFAVQERVALSIVDALDLRLTSTETRLLKDWGTRNAAAYDEFLKGNALVQHFQEIDKLHAAQGHFERALALDPEFAPALAGLASAEAQTFRNFDSDPARLARAESLVHRALAIDPQLTRAHMAAGEIRVMRYDYAGAAERFRQVAGSEPGNFQAWDYLCFALGYMSPPRVDEGERACRRAIELNPGYAESYYHLARILVLAPRPRIAEAEDAIAQLAEHYPRSTLVQSGRFWILLAAGRARDALPLVDADAAFSRTPLAAAWRVAALAQAGEHERALAVLEDALSRGYRDVADLRGSRWYEPIRSDPRFERTLARHGLAEVRR